MHSPSHFASHLESIVSGKKVGILGMAREGSSTYKTLRAFFPELPLVVMDRAHELSDEIALMLQTDPHVQVFLGTSYLDGVEDVEVIFKTPGIPSLLVQVQDAVARGAYLTSQTDVFFSVYGQRIIAVTGTKGKSTTCKVITHLLQMANTDVVSIGNIGSPAFDWVDKITDETQIVYETSSYQCEGLRTAPHIGVCLNLYADHINYHSSFSLYGEAKRQLFIHQTADDICIYNSGDQNVKTLVSGVASTHVGFSYEKNQLSTCYVEGGQVMRGEKAVIPVDKIPLLGKHNVLNVMPAIIIASLLGISEDIVARAVATVEPVEKRLETIGVVRGVTYVDDALATIPEATIAALDALGDRVQTLVVGGFDRGQDFTTLVDVISRSSVQNLILLPTTGEKIGALMKTKTDSISLYPVHSMKELVTVAAHVTHAGKIVLLSTASASFGMFADYRDRSRQFADAVESLEK